MIKTNLDTVVENFTAAKAAERAFNNAKQKYKESLKPLKQSFEMITDKKTITSEELTKLNTYLQELKKLEENSKFEKINESSQNNQENSITNPFDPFIAVVAKKRRRQRRQKSRHPQPQ